MARGIHNTIELKAEIKRLRLIKGVQEGILKQQLGSPKAMVATVSNVLSSSRKHKIDGNQPVDMFAYLSQKFLPLTLKKTLFRKSNFIVKALVGLASKRAAPHINKETVGILWQKLKPLLPETASPKNKTYHLRKLNLPD